MFCWPSDWNKLFMHSFRVEGWFRRILTCNHNWIHRKLVYASTYHLLDIALLDSYILHMKTRWNLNWIGVVRAGRLLLTPCYKLPETAVCTQLFEMGYLYWHKHSKSLSKQICSIPSIITLSVPLHWLWDFHGKIALISSSYT